LKICFCPQDFFLNQDILDEYGIRYNIVSQEKGEYVAGFPDTFHQGFNDDFSVAEAVNFEFIEWIRHGFIEYQRFIAEGCQLNVAIEDISAATSCRKSIQLSFNVSRFLLNSLNLQ
jgi:hypothetical protein